MGRVYLGSAAAAPLIRVRHDLSHVYKSYGVKGIKPEYLHPGVIQREIRSIKETDF